MKLLRELDSGRGSLMRLVAVAVFSLLLGAALAPGVATAASSAWVRVMNFPAVQKVLVTNSSKAPIYTQPPSHTIVNLNGRAYISGDAWEANIPYYTVPAGKWLVITSIKAEGQGPSPIYGLALESSDDSIHETMPTPLEHDSSTYFVSTSVGGLSYVPPGTALNLAYARSDNTGGAWGVGVWVDGYLTSTP